MFLILTVVIFSSNRLIASHHFERRLCVFFVLPTTTVDSQIVSLIYVSSEYSIQWQVARFARASPRSCQETAFIGHFLTHPFYNTLPVGQLVTVFKQKTAGKKTSGKLSVFYLAAVSSSSGE